MGEKSELGRILRRFRRERGITGGELASHVGVGQGTISKIECGRLVPDLDFLSKFASVLRLKEGDAAAVMRLAGVVPSGVTPESVLQYLPVDFLQVDWSERRQETVALAEAKSSSIRVFNPSVCRDSFKPNAMPARSSSLRAFTGRGALSEPFGPACGGNPCFKFRTNGSASF